jgi:hypothetical protein
MKKEKEKEKKRNRMIDRRFTLGAGLADTLGAGLAEPRNVRV